MGNTNAYACDGPGCEVIALRGPRKPGPDGWLVVTSGTIVDDGIVIDKARGVVHSENCAVNWLKDAIGDMQSFADPFPTVEPEPAHDEKVAVPPKPSTTSKKVEF